MLDLWSVLPIVLSLVSVAISILTFIIHHRHLKIVEKDREAKRIIEVYKVALHNWLIELERWKEYLEKRSFTVRYFPSERRCRKTEVEGFLNIQTGHRFEEEIIRARIREMHEGILTRRDKVKSALADLYASLEKLAKTLDTKEFRDWISELKELWKQKHEPRPLKVDLDTIISGIVAFLITGEEYENLKGFIREFKNELRTYQQKIRRISEWTEVENRIELMKSLVNDFYNFLTELTKSYESRYKLTLEEIEPETFTREGLRIPP